MEEQQYGLGDLRQYNGRPLFPAIPPPTEMVSCHRGVTSAHPNPFDLLVFGSDSASAIAPNSDHGGLEAEGGGLISGGAGRWPRQETLTLLEVRSRLDPKFKEANHKGPLWDEVSRIMMEEYGYQRSGKKCREKFENLYKYYKKTKDGKAGRHDGKHYRFFRQLDALYGDNSAAAVNTNLYGYNFQEPYPGGSSSVPDSCDTTTTSSYCSEANEDDESRARKRKGKGKRSVKASIDAHMKSMMEKQEAWMEKMAAVVEAKEQERLLREEQWRQRDAARIDGERRMWAAERAWVGARDAALMAAFDKLAGKSQFHPHPPPPPCHVATWQESESAWDETAAGRMCRDQVISDYLIECGKKRKEGNANKGFFTYGHDQNREAIADAGVEDATRLHGGSSGEYVNDGLLRHLIGDNYRRL